MGRKTKKQLSQEEGQKNLKVDYELYAEVDGIEVVVNIQVPCPEFSESLKKKRRERWLKGGLNPTQFLEKAGMTRQHVHQIEKGVHKTVPGHVMEAIEGALDHDFGYRDRVDTQAILEAIEEKLTYFCEDDNFGDCES